MLILILHIGLKFKTILKKQKQGKISHLMFGHMIH